MKKFITIFLAFVLSLALAVPAFAEEAPKNYAENLKWEGMSATVEVKDGVTVATGIKHAWSSPTADILPSIKAVLGAETDVEIVIVMDIHATFIEGKEGEFITGNVLLRGDNGLDIPAADTGDWTEAYEETIDGEEPFFTNPDSNIRHHFGGIRAEMTDDEWITLEIPFTIQKIHVENTAVKNWKICFDGLSNPTIVNTIEIKNFGIYLADEYEDAAPEDEPVEDEKPQEDEKPAEVTPTPTPTPTPAPTPAPTEDAPLQTPDLSSGDEDTDNGDGGMNPGIIIGIVAAVVVIGAVVAVIVIKKKKPEDK